MCHQTVGLVARHLETNGIATLTMSVGYDITARVRPPRTVFVNYPMGNTTGRPGHADEQGRIVAAALNATETMTTPGEIVDLGFTCDEPAPDGRRWQEWVYTPAYRRALMKERHGSRYQAPPE